MNFKDTHIMASDQLKYQTDMLFFQYQAPFHANKVQYKIFVDSR